MMLQKCPGKQFYSLGQIKMSKSLSICQEKLISYVLGTTFIKYLFLFLLTPYKVLVLISKEGKENRTVYMRPRDFCEIRDKGWK